MDRNLGIRGFDSWLEDSIPLIVYYLNKLDRAYCLHRWLAYLMCHAVHDKWASRWSAIY